MPDKQIRNSDIFSRLFDLLSDRKKTLPDNSYTTTLFRAGKEKISEKIVEECSELVESYQENSAKKQIVHETADLFYHAFVLLVDSGTTLHEIESELERRFGVSGLDEKASRKKT